MNTRYYRLLTPLFVLMALLTAACSSDTASDDVQSLPEGMGRIRISICTPENNPNLTRAVNVSPWEDPDHEWEKLQTFRILICDADHKVVDIISGTKADMTGETGTASTYNKRSRELRSNALTAGNYYIYATANYNDGYSIGSTVNPDATVKFANGYSATGTTQFGDENPIPMTGKLASAVIVNSGTETDAGIITVWRVMGKMQFYFTNEADHNIRIIGVEVEPINQASADGPGIYLFSKDNLESINNLAPGATPPSGSEGITLPNGARADVGTVRYQPATISPLTLAAKNDGNTDEGTLFFYVNETDATFTTTENQLSLCFKVQRQKADNQWYDEEIRYGVTTHYGNGTMGQDGFNVIRRNDWIHIPIHLTDWQFRIEPLAFVPIAGYPAMTLSSDALTATFSTGGMIALQPFVKKYDDFTWRDFSDSEITYGKEVKNGDLVDDDDSWEASIRWNNADGDTQSGVNKIVKTPFAYDPVTKCIIGELNNNLDADNYTDNGFSVYTTDEHRYFKTTFTVCLRLGPDDDETKQYVYTFTFNVILQK